MDVNGINYIKLYGSFTASCCYLLPLRSSSCVSNRCQLHVFRWMARSAPIAKACRRVSEAFRGADVTWESTIFWVGANNQNRKSMEDFKGCLREYNMETRHHQHQWSEMDINFLGFSSAKLDRIQSGTVLYINLLREWKLLNMAMAIPNGARISGSETKSLNKGRYGGVYGLKPSSCKKGICKADM